MPGIDAQLRMQDRVAQALEALRAQHGALGFETIEVETVFEGDTLHEVRPQAPNRAKSLIANLMIAANGVTARFLDARGFPSLRRVVRVAERWDRIRALAEQLARLCRRPDSIALAAFLDRRKAADPQTFPDLSTASFRLLGRGDTLSIRRGRSRPATSASPCATTRTRRRRTAGSRISWRSGWSKRRWPATRRRKPSRSWKESPRSVRAGRRGEQGRAAGPEVGGRDVVQSRVGETFDAIVTGASNKGTFVRVSSPPIEGKLSGRIPGVDVGDRLRVRRPASTSSADSSISERRRGLRRPVIGTNRAM